MGVLTGVRRRLRAASPVRKDLYLALFLVIGVTIENAAGPLLALASAPLTALPIALRRRAPLLMAALFFGVFVIAQTFAPPQGEDEAFMFSVASLLIAMYSAAAYERTIAIAAAAGALIGVGANWDLVVGGLGADDFWPFRFLFLGGAWLAGRIVHGRVLEVDELERDQEARTSAAIAEERGRLARELHDVIAHNVSVMVVQAGAAQEVLEQSPERAREPLENIQRMGRETVTELRRLLGILRIGSDQSLMAPQPGLRELDALVERVRSAGLPVEVEVRGEPHDVPASIDLSAYRIVQEGLTNALKHSQASVVQLQVSYNESAISLEIIDDGRGASANGARGHGLVGMRERVAMFGGTLDFGAGPRGGFRLHAELPTSTSRR